MSHFSTWQFVRENTAVTVLFCAVLLSLGIALWLHQLQRTATRKEKLQRLASCWLGTLSELSVTLDCMQETTRRLIRNRQKPSQLETIQKSDIFTHRWLREGFLLMAGNQAGASLVYSLNVDCDFFVWNVNQTASAQADVLGATGADQASRGEPQKTVDEFDDATIAFACNHHRGMVVDWKTSADSLDNFCIQHALNRGADLVVPSDIPIKWQRDDTKPWTIANLAFVGEIKWEE